MDVSTPVVVLAPGYHGHGVARSLGRLGVRVYGVHADPASPAMRSRYWERNYIRDIAKGPPEAAVEWLLQLDPKIGPSPILIPTDDSSCLFVADHAASLRQRFLLPDQPPGLARRLSSKKSMYFLCKAYGIPTPETLFPQSRKDVLEFLQHATFPIMLKGIDTLAVRERTGVKMVMIEDAATLLARYDEMEAPNCPSLMLQEYIPGGAEAIWMFDGYFDDDSNCLFGLTGKKIRQYPAYTGLTSLGICRANEDVGRLTKDFMKAIGYRGILDLGYKYDARTGEYKLLDVNPRLGSTFRLFVDTLGMDVVRALYLDLTGQSISTGTNTEGRKWLVENLDLVSSLRYWRDGQLTPGEWLRSFRGVEEFCWFARDDPFPTLAMAWRSMFWTLERVESPKLLPLGRRRQNSETTFEASRAVASVGNIAE